MTEKCWDWIIHQWAMIPWLMMNIHIWNVLKTHLCQICSNHNRRDSEWFVRNTSRCYINIIYITHYSALPKTFLKSWNCSLHSSERKTVLTTTTILTIIQNFVRVLKSDNSLQQIFYKGNIIVLNNKGGLGRRYSHQISMHCPAAQIFS